LDDLLEFLAVVGDAAAGPPSVKLGDDERHGPDVVGGLARILQRVDRLRLGDTRPILSMHLLRARDPRPS